MQTSTHTDALQKAVELAGGQKPLADKIGTSQSQVWYWLTRSKRGVPAEFVMAIEQATDGQVSRHELRPDIYPQPDNGESHAAAPGDEQPGRAA